MFGMTREDIVVEVEERFSASLDDVGRLYENTFKISATLAKRVNISGSNDVPAK